MEKVENICQEKNRIIGIGKKYTSTMENKKHIFGLMALMTLSAFAVYLSVNLFFGFKYLPNFSTDNDGIGKIKYVDALGNDVFASASAVVFTNPISVSSVSIDGDIAEIEVSEFSIVRAPAYGVVIIANDGIVEIDHGNETKSTISGLTNIAVNENDVVFAGFPIGSTTSNVKFSVEVSQLPLDMRWLLETNEK